jgi:hypothetical protein
MDKADIFVYIFIGLVILFSVNMFLKSDMVNLKCIISDVDGKTYCIRDRSKLKEAANLLAKVTNTCTTLVNHMYTEYPADERCKQLYRNYNPSKITETLPTSKLKAYSENKGEKIAFCLNKQNENNETLIDENTLTFVALHELSHLMTPSIGHQKEFWDNFKFLLDNAVEIKVYDPINYKTNPQTYCGMKITDNPYYDI